MTSFRALSRAQRRLLLAALVLVTSAGMLGTAEIVVRVRHRLKFGSLWGIEQTYTIDPKSGLRIPIPGGNFGGIHINSLGFRGPEIPVPKSSSTLRVAFLGSSTTYCAEVSNNENAWPHLVAEELQSKWPAVKVDYVNAGVPGYTVRTSLRNLESRVATLQPDIIVIYEGHNDISGNSLDLAVTQGIASRATEETLSWPSRYSLLWYLVEKNLLVMQHERAATELKGKLVFDEESLVVPFRRDLADLIKGSERAARLVAVVTLSPQVRREQSPDQQMHAARTSLYYMPFISIEDLMQLYDRYNAVISQVSRQNGALLISDEYSIPGSVEYFADSVHFTDKGSHLMAQRVSRELMRSTVAEEIVASKSRGSHLLGQNR